MLRGVRYVGRSEVYWEAWGVLGGVVCVMRSVRSGTCTIVER